jgi:hypothetical protein
MTDTLKTKPYNDGMQKIFFLEFGLYGIGAFLFTLAPEHAIDLIMHLPDTAPPLWKTELGVMAQLIGAYLFLLAHFHRMAT